MIIIAKASDNADMTKQYYYGLDALRFAAAMSVCIFHLAFYSWASEGSSASRMLDDATAYPLLVPVSWFGWVGVEVFFVISGFVIANSANGASPLAFLKSRMLRLFPAAWICATLTLIALLLVSHDPDRANLLPYLHSMTLWLRGPWVDGVYWSLAVEIAFYALVFAILLVGRFSLLPLLAVVLAIGSGAFTLLERGIALGLVAPMGWWNWIGQNADVLLLRHGVYFALGIWFWMMARRSLPWSGRIGIPAAIGLCGLEVWTRASSVKFYEATEAGGQSSLLPIAAWLIAILILGLAVRYPKRFEPKSERGLFTVKWLGQATYPFYLLHDVFGAGVLHTLLDAGVQRHVALFLAILIATLAALGVAAFVEPVVRDALRAGLKSVEKRLSSFGQFGFLFRQADRIS